MKHLLFLVIIVSTLAACNKEPKLYKLNGTVFGTSYNIQYYNSQDAAFSTSIDSLFVVLNKSMSNYQVNSDISKLNRNEDVVLDAHFNTVFNASKRVFLKTNGVFDPTIGNLVNYWNFGAQRNESAIDSTVIDSLIKFVDFNKVTLKNNKVLKPTQTYIDFNAIAKGYAVDVISNFFTSKGITNHLVEIGGEIRVKGKNLNKKQFWTVGIQEPNFDGNTSYNKVIKLQNQAMATSGTYRKFKVDKDGNRYAHIINTKTGYPSKTNVLSVSVIAKNCMLADAYATAFQAMGINAVTAFLNQNKSMKAFIIYENQKQEFETLNLNNFGVE